LAFIQSQHKKCPKNGFHAPAKWRRTPRGATGRVEAQIKNIRVNSRCYINFGTVVVDQILFFRRGLAKGPRPGLEQLKAGNDGGTPWPAEFTGRR
jgi:hypothetical protein